MPFSWVRGSGKMNGNGKLPILINGQQIESKEAQETLRLEIPLSVLEKFYNDVLHMEMPVKRATNSRGNTYITNRKSLLAPFQSWLFATIEVWSEKGKVTLAVKSPKKQAKQAEAEQPEANQ